MCRKMYKCVSCNIPRHTTAGWRWKEEGNEYNSITTYTTYIYDGNLDSLATAWGGYYYKCVIFKYILEQLMRKLIQHHWHYSDVELGYFSFVVSLDMLLNKQSSCCWFMMPWCSHGVHSNGWMPWKFPATMPWGECHRTLTIVSQ